MTSFLQKRDPWGHGMALWVLLGMVFLMPLAWWSIRKIELENDIENWLPSDDPQAQILAWYRDQFPVEDRILVSWKGSSLNDPRGAALARKLEGVRGKDGVYRGGLEYVKDVMTPQAVIARMRDAGRGRISTETAIERLEGVLIGKGLLKVQLTEAGRLRSKRVKRQLVKRARGELALDLRIVPNEFDLAEEIEYGDEDAEEDAEEFPMAPDHDFQISWKGMHSGDGNVESVKTLVTGLRGPPTAKNPKGERWVESCFFFSGSPVAMFVALSEAGTEEPREAFAAIRAAAVEVGIPANEFHLGGRAVAGSELNRQVKKAAWNTDYPLSKLHKRSPMLLSALVGVLLAFVLLRSFRLAFLVLVVANFTTFLTIALVPLTNGSMNMVLVVMPTLLSVLTMSAAIHVANYWKHAACKDMRTAVFEALKMARQPCVLAGLTTAVGLAALMTSPLRPVRDFGMYSAVGCLISVVAALVCLPALLMFLPPKRPEKTEVEGAFWKSLAEFLSKHRSAVTVASLLVLAVSAYGLKHFRTETKVIRHFPDDSRIVRDYRFLEENLAGIVPIDVVVRFDETAMQELDFFERMEIVRSIEQVMREHPEISGTMSLADFQAVHKPLPKKVSLPRKMDHTARVRATETRIKEEESGARAFLTEARNPAQLESPQGRSIAVAAGDELWRITAQAAIMSEFNYGQLTRDLNEVARSKLKYHAGADHVVTGMVPVFLRTQQAVLDSLIRSFALAFVVIALVMMFVLKNPISGLISMLPNLMPIVVVFGLISWANMAVDIGTMITASVALGIAVDGTLHLLTWFRKGIADGLPRKEAVSRALVRCGPAMWQTSAAVGIGLLMLFGAELLLIHRFGWLMAALIGTAFLADVIFLPALLAGPLGSLIERTVNRQSQEDETPPDGLPEPTAPQSPHVLSLLSKKDGKIYRVD